jgi:hypothetical protein
MKETIPFEWESIGVYPGAERVKVFGGWLVVVDVTQYKHTATTFVPDKNHEWEVEE